MIDFTHAKIEKLVIHKIGNKSMEEGVSLSKSEIELQDESTADILLSFFLSPFKSEDIYCFNPSKTHGEESVKEYTKQLFADSNQFYIQSAHIAKLLYEVSAHPNIKQGELYIASLSGCTVHDEEVDAIGIFKSEHKDTYIKIYQNNDRYDVDPEQGINIKKLDKACIICNADSEHGNILKIADNTNKNNEAVYWLEDFISAKIIETNYFNTNTFVKLCKEFSDNVLTEDNNVEKKEQLAFMAKSYDFLRQNPQVDIEDFKTEVIGNEQVIEHFNNFKEEFEESQDITPQSHFEVSQDALKKAKKYVKSVIKLDRNFHVYVHSRPDFIEKGFDNARNMNFYKLFFETES